MNIQVLLEFLKLSVICMVLIPFIYLANELGRGLFEKKVIKIKYHTDGIEISKISIGDWIDLRSAEDVVLKAGDFRKINLGIGMKLPYGFEAHVVPRSSTFETWGIIQTNSMGVIDNSYSGNNDIWKFPAYATRDTEIKKGERICQFRIIKKASMELKTVEDLGNNNRGGFGTTGKN